MTGRGNIGLEFACLGKKPIIAGVNYYSDLGFVSFPQTQRLLILYLIKNMTTDQRQTNIRC